MSADKSKAPRILVVDDNADVREALRLLLKGAGFIVVLASSPAGAEAAVSAVAPCSRGHELHLRRSDEVPVERHAGERP